VKPDLASLSLYVALLPLALLALACFLKQSIVLSLLGRAIGGRSLPSTMVFGAALLLVAFVLAPVAEALLRDTGGAVAKGDLGAVSTKGAESVRGFLERHAPRDARDEMLRLQQGLRAPEERASVSEHDLVVLLPAFALGELKAAFRIGFFLLLPFLVIDLLIGVVLLGVGLHTVETRVVALPLKLLLFVAVDGWSLVVRGLLVGYTSG